MAVARGRWRRRQSGPSTPIDAAPAHPTAAATKRAELEAMFGFEGPLENWTLSPANTAVIDPVVVHGGHGALRVERSAATGGPFSSVATHVPIDFSGSTVEVRGVLRTKDVQGSAGFWLREDGDDGPVQFVNMQDAKLEGTTEWKQYSISLPLDPKATQLLCGVLLVGTGTTWADDLQILVDGKPIWNAPFVQKIDDEDHQFDHGSGISVTTLAPIQIENLATLGKVWGFLAYHHPKVTHGDLHWDAELLRI
ncbi:MAG TPA: hypothetical protein VGC41_15330, partial [Kofleriaceae bacterium]